MDLQWVLNHSSEVKNVIVAVLSKETRDDIDRFKKNLEKGLDIVFDILREPAQEAGVEIDLMRDLPSKEAEEVKAQLEVLQAN